MTVDELLDAVAHMEPEEVPAFLADQVALLLHEFLPLLERIAQIPIAARSRSTAVLIGWVTRFRHLGDGILVPDAPGALLTPFASVLLERLALEWAGLDALPRNLPDSYEDDVVRLCLMVEEDVLARSRSDDEDMSYRERLGEILCGTLPVARDVSPRACEAAARVVRLLATAFLDASWRATPVKSDDPLTVGLRWLEQALGVLDTDSRECVRCSVQLARALILRYERQGNPADLQQALDLYQDANDALGDEIALRAVCHEEWAHAVFRRAEAYGRPSDLDDAVRLYDLARDEHEQVRKQWLQDESDRLHSILKDLNSYLSTGVLPDNDALVRLMRSFPSQRALMDELFERVDALSTQSRQSAWTTGNLLETPEDELPPAPARDLRYALHQAQYAAALQMRYEEWGNPDDLDQAIAIYDAASWHTAEATERELDQGLFLIERGKALLSRYDALGDPKDLRTAAGAFAAAIPAFRDSPPRQPMMLLHYADAQLREWEAEGHSDTDTLNSLLGCYQFAVDNAPANSSLEALSNMKLGLAHLRAVERGFGGQDSHRRAMSCLQHAADLFRAVDAPVRTYTALTHLARAWLVGDARGWVVDGNRLGAYQPLKEAIGLLENRVIDLPEQALQTYLLGAQRATYQYMVGICVGLSLEATTAAERLEYRQKAWEYAERAKARMTVQMLREAAGLPSGTLTGADSGPDIEALLELLRAIAELEHQLGLLSRTAEAVLSGERGMAPAAEPRISSDRRAHIDKLKQQWSAFHARLREIDPGLAGLREIAAPNLEAVQNAIPDGGLLVEFFPLPFVLAVFIADGHELYLDFVEITEQELEDQTSRFLNPLNALRSQEAPRSSDRAALKRYQADRQQRWQEYTQALEASLAWLADHLRPVLSPYSRSDAVAADVPHLLLVPTGPLHLWPLHALPLPSADERVFDTARQAYLYDPVSCRRLLDQWACSFLPAADALPALETQQPKPGPYCGMAPATNLGFARTQLHYEQQTLDGDAGTVYTGTAASLQTLRERVGGPVSFATHALVQLEHPELSVMCLTRGDGSPHDVLALEFAIALRHLASPLIMLWACETHGASVQGGDTWAGISQAFLRAGRTLLASLWPIDDAATLALSVPLCDGLRDGLTIPQALRQAMLALRDAGWAQVAKWRERITPVLSDDEQGAFLDAWQEAVGEPSSPSLWAESAPYFNELRYWAPYLAIGWPGPLPR